MIYFAWGTEATRLVAMLDHDRFIARFYGLVIWNVFVGFFVRGNRAAVKEGSAGR